MNWVTPDQLCQRFDGFLFDAYGVLVDSDGILAGADTFLQRLRDLGKPFAIISNDASSTPEAKVERWASRGLHVEVERLITPWQVLASEETPLSLNGLGCFLIGTPLSRMMLWMAGGELVDSAEAMDALVIADEIDHHVLHRCDEALSLVVECIKAGREPRLVLVNPDLIYPRARGFGFTSGSLALMFEEALQRLFGREFRFTPIGKPQPYLYELGLMALGVPRDRVTMIGDQLETDIAGALSVGIQPVLIGTGISPLTTETLHREPRALHLADFRTGP
jgi:HAD superfamily hydrolase (TIGR01450 family)